MATGKTHGSLKKPTPPVTNNEVGPRFELLKIARCHWLLKHTEIMVAGRKVGFKS